VECGSAATAFADGVTNPLRPGENMHAQKGGSSAAALQDGLRPQITRLEMRLNPAVEAREGIR